MKIELKTQQDLTLSLKTDVVPGDGVYKIGDGLKLDKFSMTLSVDTVDRVEQDNTRPVTSAAVYTEVGNIEALLAAL